MKNSPILEFSPRTGGLVEVSSISGNLGLMHKKADKKVVKRAAAKRILGPKSVARAKIIQKKARRGDRKALLQVARLKRIAANKKKPVSAAIARSAVEVIKESYEADSSAAEPMTLVQKQSDQIKRGQSSMLIPPSDASPTSEEYTNMEPTRDMETEEQSEAESEDEEVTEDEMEAETDDMTDAETGACVGLALVGINPLKKVIRGTGRIVKKVPGGKFVTKNVGNVIKKVVSVNKAIGKLTLQGFKVVGMAAAKVAAAPMGILFKNLANRRSNYIAWVTQGDKNPTRNQKLEGAQWALNQLRSKGALGKLSAFILVNTGKTKISGDVGYRHMDIAGNIGAVETATILAIASAAIALMKLMLDQLNKPGQAPTDLSNIPKGDTAESNDE
jgi:hypothetical protein